MEVVTVQAEEEYLKSFKTNVFIAVLTTAHARLKLYEALETLQERVLYYDTDSVIYRWRPAQAEIPLGDYLGDLWLPYPQWTHRMQSAWLFLKFPNQADFELSKHEGEHFKGVARPTGNPEKHEHCR